MTAPPGALSVRRRRPGGRPRRRGGEPPVTMQVMAGAGSRLARNIKRAACRFGKHDKERIKRT